MTAYSSSLSESLATLDSYSAVMPNWYAFPPTELISTDDTLSHRYSAVRNLTDVVGRNTLGILTMPLLFPVGGNMESVTRVAQSHRLFVETPSASDVASQRLTIIRPLPEALTTSDAMTLRQTLVRSSSEVLTTSDSTIRPVRHYARTVLSQIGSDRLVSPMLLFPVPRLDVVTRLHGSVRVVSELNHSFDTPIAIPRFARSLIESNPTIGILLRHVAIRRPAGNTLTTSSALVRRIIAVRTNQIGSYIWNYDTSVCGSAIAGWALPGRVGIPPNVFTERLTRRTTSYRAISNSIPAAATIAVISLKPRSLVETLTTHDAITLEQLLGRIMGDIWVDASGHAISNLPDWGWVLVEDPTTGNAMFVYEVPTATTIDLMREK